MNKCFKCNILADWLEVQGMAFQMHMQSQNGSGHGLPNFDNERKQQ